jgi:catechol 2,3-dioxygenase-like lactoylglutathione lyase family enzyme
MPKVKGFSHIVLYVNDLEKMSAFYQDVLGLIKYHENPGRMIFLIPDPDIDDHQIALAQGREGDAKIVAQASGLAPTASH